MKSKLVLFWFRRDLRVEDNVGLFNALESGFPVLPLFIFDPAILNQLEDKKDRRVDYIHQALTSINDDLKALGSRLHTYHEEPIEVFKKLANAFDIQAVYCNRDYEPQAIQRDVNIVNYLQDLNIPLKAFKDQVIFDKNDILKKDDKPYTVYTPYANKWKATLETKDHGLLEMNFKHFYQEKH